MPFFCNNWDGRKNEANIEQELKLSIQPQRLRSKYYILILIKFTIPLLNRFYIWVNDGLSTEENE